MSHMHMRHHSLFLFLLSSAIMNLTLFIFAFMKFHLIHFSQRSSSAQPFNLFFFWYVAICSNSVRSFLICSIWMIHHSPYYSIWLNSNWIFSISFPPKHSFMVTLYLSNHSNWDKSNWMFFRLVKFRKIMRSRKKNALYLLPRLVGTCTISYQEKREGNEKNRVKTNTFVSILVPYSQPH